MTMTVLFPLLIKAVEPGEFATVVVGRANVIFALVVAIFSSFVGAVADFKGYKKKLFIFFLLVGIIFGALLGLPNLNLISVVIIYVLSMIGYNFANIMYDAFLVDVCDEDRMNLVSSAGFGFGYIGSVIPFMIFIIPFAFHTVAIGIDNSYSFLGFDITYRVSIFISMLLGVIFWAVISIPMIKNVKQKYYVDIPENFIAETTKSIYDMLKMLSKNKNLLIFTIAYFLYIDCVNTVIIMSIAIASDAGITPVISLLLVIMSQFVAFPCAIIFGRLADKYGSKNMILIAILGYIGIVILSTRIVVKPNIIFLISILISMFQGGIQAVSRSMYAKLIPDKKNSNQYFALFSIFTKFSAILGPTFVTTVVALTNNVAMGMLGLLPTVTTGFILMAFVKDENIN